ncbi:MAG: hypothetical protein WAV32_09985 [Halobacteriota archaeon]
MTTINTTEKDSITGTRKKLLLYDVPEFLEPYLQDAIEFLDIDTLSAVLGLKRMEAVQVVIKYNEDLAGYKVREVFCTKEARELVRGILGMFSVYPATKNGRDMFLTLTPSRDKEELQRRFRDIKNGEELRASMSDALVANLRIILSKAKIEKVRFGEAAVIATRSKEIEREVKAIYGEFVRVELVDSAVKARELVQEGNTIILIGEGIGEDLVDAPGVIIRSHGELSDACEIYPEFVVNSFVSKQKAIEAVLTILNEFSVIKKSWMFKEVSVGDLEEVMAILDGVAEERGKGGIDFDGLILGWEAAINKEAARIMRTGSGAAAFSDYLDVTLDNMADELMLSREDKEVLSASAYETLEAGLPFEFAREKIGQLRPRYNRDRCERRYYKLRDLAKQLERHRDVVSAAIKKLIDLDFILATSQIRRDFGLNIPEITERGVGVIGGRHLFLLDEARKGGEKVVPVSYSIGEANSGIFGATPHPVAILTGANSGGKTCLLITLASSIALTELGLPVPAERAGIPLLPLYLYRRKMIRKTGSFEYSMRALSRIFMREGGKVVLIDELEALTEPGAMGRIMAAMLNNFPKDTLAVVITHLIHEILPHIRMGKVRVDGIEPEGLDSAGNMIVDRQPLFNHIGSSTPELVIKKLLGKVKRENLKVVYEEIIDVLEKEREVVSRK